MSVLKFTKMHGIGNDYIYFDCFETAVNDPNALSERLSDRHFSIGGDGIVLMCPTPDADVQMRMFNADGSEGKMCGNAIRCVAKYMYERRKIGKTEITVSTLSGIKKLQLFVNDNNEVYSVKVNMGKADFNPSTIPVNLPEAEVVNRPTQIAGGSYNITCVSMGNPHCVLFGQDPADIELEKIGPLFENDAIFPQRVNTEFVKVIDKTHLKMRVWERGSGETMACGTGACAVVSAAVKCGYCEANTEVTVQLIGGELKITYTPDAVFMTGPAAIAFDGSVEV